MLQVRAVSLSNTAAPELQQCREDRGPAPGSALAQALAGAIRSDSVLTLCSWNSGHRLPRRHPPKPVSCRHQTFDVTKPYPTTQHCSWTGNESNSFAALLCFLAQDKPQQQAEELANSTTKSMLCNFGTFFFVLLLFTKAFIRKAC